MANTFIPIDEALSLAAGLGQAPAGLSGKEILDAFVEESEVDYENSGSDDHRLAPALGVRKDICVTRYNLYELLETAIQYELGDEEKCPFKTTTEDDQTLIDVVSFSLWLYHDYGIDIPLHAYIDLLEINNLPQDAAWKDIAITLTNIDLISFVYKDGDPIKKSFYDIGLADKRNNLPNSEAGMLLGLSKKIKFPPDGMDIGYAKRLMHGLRKLLRAFTGISSDPFRVKTEADGWLPRFKLINNSKSDSFRELKSILMAKKSSAYNYVRIPDDAQSFIDEAEELPK